MPSYDHLCPHCGPFTDIRPMSLSHEPRDCPRCGESAPRALLTVPFLSTMEAGRRAAIGRNEASAHAPRLASAAGETSRRPHGANCGCCKPGGRSSAVFTADGGKTFPSKRPWMISH